MVEVAEVRTPSGIILPQIEGVLRAWVKPRGEPAMILIETPSEVFARVRAAEQLDASHLVVHEWSYGQPSYIPRAWFRDMNIGVTYKNAGKTTAGSYWARTCPCNICEWGRTPEGERSDQPPVM